MSFPKILDVAVIVFILFGAWNGFRDSLKNKIIDLIKTIVIFTIIILIMPYLNKIFNLVSLDFAYVNNANHAISYSTRLLSRHIINIVSYVVLYLLLQAIISLILKPYMDKKQKKSLLNRLGGALWGAGNNIIIVAMVMVIIVPVSGLSNEVAQTTVVDALYEPSVSLFSTATSKDSNDNAGGSVICVMSRNAISDQECDYVFEGMVIITSQVFNKNFFNNYFSQFANFEEGYDLESEEVKTLLGMYFKTLYSALALIYLSGPTSEKVLLDARVLVEDLLQYNDLPLQIYENNDLKSSINKIYKYYEFDAYLNDLLKAFK